MDACFRILDARRLGSGQHRGRQRNGGMDGEARVGSQRAQHRLEVEVVGMLVGDQDGLDTRKRRIKR